MKKNLFLTLLLLLSYNSFSETVNIEKFFPKNKRFYLHDIYEKQVELKEYFKNTNLMDIDFGLVDKFIEKYDENVNELKEKELRVKFFDSNSKPYKEHITTGMYKKIYEKTKMMHEQIIPYYKKIQEAEKVHRTYEYKALRDKDGMEISEIYKHRILNSFEDGKEAMEKEMQAYERTRPFAKMYPEFMSNIDKINEKSKDLAYLFNNEDLKSLKEKIEPIKTHLGNNQGSSFNDSLDYLYDILKQESEESYYLSSEIMREFIYPLADPNNRGIAKEIYDKYMRGKKEKLIEKIEKIERVDLGIESLIFEKGIYSEISKNSLLLGYAKEFDSNLKISAFAKYEKDEISKFSVISMAKYMDVAAVLTNTRNYENENNISNKTDLHLVYAKEIPLNKNFKIRPLISNAFIYNGKFETDKYILNPKLSNLTTLALALRYETENKLSLSLENELKYLLDGNRELIDKKTNEKEILEKKNKLSYNLGVKLEKEIDKFKIGIKTSVNTGKKVQTKVILGYIF